MAPHAGLLCLLSNGQRTVILRVRSNSEAVCADLSYTLESANPCRE